MSKANNKDWKLQIIDQLDEFASSIGDNLDQIADYFFADDGQANLTADAMRQFHLSGDFKGGTITAFELGKYFGYWTDNWKKLFHHRGGFEELSEAHSKITETMEGFNLFPKSALPESAHEILMGLLSILSEILDPETLERARANSSKFDSIHDSVMEFIELQPESERSAFRKGYRQAMANEATDSNGNPLAPDKVSTLLPYLRPLARDAGYSAESLQELIDLMCGCQITGSHDGFAKRLQRKKASLRGKGRPKKRPE